ncbi:MAG: DUF4097 family beta strand repeat protein [Pyrinomonadaceae bacterium]|nr:DUF4097 family beta strand repeat protein [Pyrinomonadaceae bacterium]
MKRTPLTLLLAVSLLLGFTSSFKAQQQTAQELREEVHRTFPLSADGRISLENISGAVKITAWDRNEVKLDAVKRAYTRERLDEVKIGIVSDANSLDISTEYPERNYRFNDGKDRRDNHARVDYTLTVPRNARIDGIELVSGSLEIEGLTGDVKASLVSGSVTARGLSGEAKLSTVSGRLDATFNHLNAAKQISLGSVSGQLIVTIPSDANAQLRANTVSGQITNDFGLPVRRGDYVGRDLAGTLGSGSGPRIKLSNVSGQIAIKHAADGRPLSPATNQLPENGRDDDDDDDSDEDEDVAGGVRRNVQRSVRDAARQSSRAQAEAQRAARATQREGQRDAIRAQAEAAREAREARQAALADAREARLEAERAVREAQAENTEEVRKTQREAQREAQRAVRESRRDIERVRPDALRAAREATRDMHINDEDQDLRLVERESKSFPTSGVPRVVLNTFDGRISIRAWDKPEVMLTAIKRAGSEQALRGISVKATQQGSEVNVQTDYDKAAGRRADGVYSTNASVTLEVFVPRHTNIHANSGDGRVELEGVTGGVMLQTGDGRIEVRDGGGQLSAKTGDGRIEVLNYTGDVDAKTGDGRINLDGRFAQLAARTGSGPILLALPDDLDAIIETDTESVTGDGLALEAEPNVGKKLRRFKIGRGGNVFRLQTGDGSIYLRRR